MRARRTSGIHCIKHGDAARFEISERPVAAHQHRDQRARQVREGGREHFGLGAKAEDRRTWSAFTPGANWRRPQGAGSGISGREKFPVVHVSHDDAEIGRAHV